MRRLTSIVTAGLAISLASAARAQAPATVPPPPAPVSAQPVPLPAPAVLPAPSMSRRVPRFAAPLASLRPTPLAAPAGSPRPDSLVHQSERVTLVSPTPLERPAPTRRVREFGRVRVDVAQLAAPASATGRCKDGTYLTATANDDACAGKGGLALRVPRAAAAPVAPAAPGRRQ